MIKKNKENKKGGKATFLNITLGEKML